jgi:hypothetical protein
MTEPEEGSSGLDRAEMDHMTTRPDPTAASAVGDERATRDPLSYFT